MGGYSSIYEQYSDYKYAVSQYLTEYLEYKSLNMPAEQYGGWNAYAVRPDHFGRLAPFALSETASVRVEKKLAAITERSQASEIFLPFDYLCRTFLLDKEERLVLAACFLMSLYPELSDTYAFINNNINTSSLTLASAAAVFFPSDPAKMYSFADRSISLLFDELRDPVSSELKLSKRIIRLLLGTGLIFQMPYSETFAVNDEIPEIYGRDGQLSLVSSAKKECIFLVEGASGTGKKFFVKHAAKRRNINVIFADLSEIPDEDPRKTANELRREMMIQRACCCFINADEKNSAKAERIIENFGGRHTVFMCAEKNLAFKKTAPYRLHLDDLSYENKLNIWRQLPIAEEKFPVVEKLAAAYGFGPSKIRKIITDCEMTAKLQGFDQVTEQLLEKVCLDASEGILKDKAARIITSFGLNDLILPQREKSLMIEGINYIKFRHRVFDNWNFSAKSVGGRGLSMLFEGSPGTGKTMAASIVANELGLPLFKVDLSKMMSKYIGETEKSLGEVFDIAEQNSAVLLFDETDALFGKRSEIKDSHDKYANVETSFLLQKMDEWGGIIVMTTNFKQNIDDAFMRRITYIIHFPAPDRDCRLELWKSVFPSEAPLDKGVDLPFLAERFEMTGAMIRSAALSSAFTAAANDRSISMADIIPAVKKQFAKFGKNIARSEFGPYSEFADE